MINLPRSDVLKYHLEDGSLFCLCPSGTQLKAKYYFRVQGASLEDSQEKLSIIQKTILDRAKDLQGL